MMYYVRTSRGYHAWKDGDFVVTADFHHATKTTSLKEAGRMLRYANMRAPGSEIVTAKIEVSVSVVEDMPQKMQEIHFKSAMDKLTDEEYSAVHTHALKEWIP
jgi:sugar diacid utilization regulator